MNKINLLIINSRYEEALVLIEKTISEKSNKIGNNDLLLNRAYVMMQLEIISQNYNKDIFNQVHEILTEIDEHKEEIYVRKNLLMLKCYYYQKKTIERSDIFDRKRY